MSCSLIESIFENQQMKKYPITYLSYPPYELKID